MTAEDNPRAIRAQDAAAEQAEQEGRFLYDEFMTAARACDVHQLCRFAPYVEHRDACQVCMSVPKRPQSFDEVMESTLDLGDGPRLAELLQLLCEVAYSGKPPQLELVAARALLDRMADSFATHNRKGE